MQEGIIRGEPWMNSFPLSSQEAGCSIPDGGMAKPMSGLEME